MLFSSGVIFLVSLSLGYAVNRQNGDSLTSPTNRLSLEDSSSSSKESSFSSHKPIFFDITNRDRPNIPNNGEDMAGICFFGEMPSASCKLRCLREGKTPQCDEARCFCRDMQEHDDNNKDDSDDSNEHVEISIIPVFNPPPVGLCFPGGYPSPTCRVRCWIRGQAALCDGYNNCWCDEDDYSDRNNTGPVVVQHHNPPSDHKHEEDHKEDDKSKPGFVLYIIHLLTPWNYTEPQGHETDIHKGNFLWTIPHILVLVFLALLLVLVALECVFFCTRRRSFIKQNVQNILSPPVLEKVNINGKV